MSEQNISAALDKLSAGWLAQAQKAEQQGRQLSVGNIQQAFYQRGIAEGLRVAVTDLKILLEHPGSETVNEVNEPIEFKQVSREAALALLIRAGLKTNELHIHSDHSFSAILPPLQAISFEDHLDKLTELADVIILAQGRLPNSSKAYIGFAFRKPTPT